jgi:hypothetical protein
LARSLAATKLTAVPDDIHAVTIVTSRYGGTYEPGVWLAFPYWPEDIPPDWNADDVTCAAFFADPVRIEEIGGGDTLQAAYDDLCHRRAARRRRLRPD